MIEQDAHYQAARRRVVRRIRRRFIFAVDVLLFALTLAAHNPKIDVVVVWLPLLVAHFTYAFDIWSNWIERATRREMEHTQLQSGSAAYVAEKRKRKTPERLALSDDGELSDDSDDEAVYYAEERRQ